LKIPFCIVKNGSLPSCRFKLPASLFLFIVTFVADAQDRLKTMPGYEQYHRMSSQMTNVMISGALSVTWKDGGEAFEYDHGGKRFRYDIESQKKTELSKTSTNRTSADSERSPSRRQSRMTDSAPARGRQYTAARSPDGNYTAVYRDRNVWLTTTNNTNGFAVTTDGNAKTRVKFGSANWTYGEELYQSRAMWWSSNSQKLAFYRFDESKIPDFALQLNQTKIESIADLEPYMKAGSNNPVVDIFIYDVRSRKTVKADVRDGKPFGDSSTGHYIYAVSWSKDSSELLFHRTDRRQKVMELCAADPESGKCRVIVREEWLPSWTENLPTFRFLRDGKRFIWASERTGWKNFYLYDLSGKLLSTLTRHSFEVGEISHVDEEGERLFYTARDGDNPLKLQLHSVRFDSTDEKRLTDPAFHHTVNVSPDAKYFIDVAQTHDTPPLSTLFKSDGTRVEQLAVSDLTRFRKLDLKATELFKFKAADGKTDLYGLLQFPSGFRPYKRYPLLVSVYGGPETSGARETFATPSVLTEFGFLIATLDSRSAEGRGKRALDAFYQNFGRIEIDDQAAGVKALGERRYLNRNRVGIFGTSYGGMASAMALLRYPEVFHAASASSGVMDFRNYDTIYTERYLGLPQENPGVYDAASVIKRAGDLSGRLMIYYGTADDNVHPNNAMQLIRALQRAGKSFEVQVGPDLGHGAVNRERMMEFFIENLVMR
jgi:dipeptidyl-peptidase 4